MKVDELVAAYLEQREAFLRLEAQSDLALCGLTTGAFEADVLREAQSVCADALNAHDAYLRARRRLLATLMAQRRDVLGGRDRVAL